VAISRFREQFPEFRDEKLSYIGRLDPMAEGVFLVLIGEENKNREQYLGLDKEYEAEILFGAITDSLDILGVVENHPLSGSSAKWGFNLAEEPLSGVEQTISSFVGDFEFEYPAYSSKTVAGKPLWLWAREGRINEIEIPKRKSTIYNIEILDFYEREKDKLHKRIFDDLSFVSGDFRQEEIKKSWQDFFGNSDKEVFQILKIKVKCGTGTYIRSLAKEIGKKLNMPTMALSIKRTKIF